VQASEKDTIAGLGKSVAIQELADHARVSVQLLCSLMSDYITHVGVAAVSFDQARFRVGKSFTPVPMEGIPTLRCVAAADGYYDATKRYDSVQICLGNDEKRFGRLRALFSWKDFNSKEHLLALIQDFRNFVHIEQPFDEDHRIIRQVIAGVEEHVNDKDFSIIPVNSVDFPVYLKPNFAYQGAAGLESYFLLTPVHI